MVDVLNRREAVVPLSPEKLDRVFQKARGTAWAEPAASEQNVDDIARQLFDFRRKTSVFRSS